MSSLRQSESCWVSDGQSELVDLLAHRMNWITGLHTSALLDPEGRKEEFEYLQLASYGTGGYYRVHQVELRETDKVGLGRSLNAFLDLLCYDHVCESVTFAHELERNFLVRWPSLLQNDSDLVIMVVSTG